MTDILGIESLLAEVGLALDQLLLAENAMALEALVDLVARIEGEVEALAAGEALGRGDDLTI